ncbi:latexin isoform X1 [Periophthalmus magnuspinnatus]|uniref:latexin isoform X1 n=1 Tax=Periophthalmus magnuspinnatus TaxID=409849 RepID=UPI00145B4B0C|nr:latexin isoform X1 [Periophthalmus magnuspinnatus]
MSVQTIISLALLTWTIGNARATQKPEDSMDNNFSPATVKVIVEAEIVEETMQTGELNPHHYPAQRAARAVQHYINTRYGSPFKVFMINKVHSGNAEDINNAGRKYQLEISFQEIISNSTHKCSAEVLFPRGEIQGSPEVSVLCEELETLNTTKDDEALYQKLKTRQSMVVAQNLPDSHGHIDPDMKPLWYLGIVASSFIMLKESTENTLYNMAQVGNVTQLATETDELKFDYFILLHDMVSQEIIRWKLQINWSPLEGVKVQQMEKMPHCHECKKPPNTE